MIGMLDGTLEYRDSTSALILAGGVGFEVMMPAPELMSLPPVGTQLRVYTHLIVNENTGVSLVGFREREALSMFRMLITVSGIGPKAALAILSVHTPESFAACVLSSDIKGITKAAGVGAKLAQRICLELKDKIAKTKVVPADIPEEGYEASLTDTVSEAVAVLIALGYTKNDATKAVLKCSADNTNDLVKQALRILSRNL